MVDWANIKIRIPTVLPERANPLAELGNQLREHTGQSPWVSPHPKGHPPNDRVRRIFDTSVDSEWILYIEDDVYLASTFGDVVPKTLEQTERVAVQFFDLRDGGAGPQTAQKPLHSMCCVAIRGGVVEGFVDFYYDWIDTTNHQDAVDIAFGEYTTALRESVAVYRPSQVQHRELPSTFGGRSTSRQSPTFEE